MSSSSSSRRVGVIGLGNMGTAMYPHIGRYAAEQGWPPVTVYNRTASKYDKLPANAFPDAHFAKTPQEVGERCDLIFAVLLDDAAAESTWTAVLETAKPGTVLVDQSSIHPDTSARLEQQAQAKGVVYLACPIFGQPPAAEKQALVLVLSGDPKGVEVIRPWIKPVLGREIIDCGRDVRKGTELKFLGNAFILGQIQLLSESFALSDAMGFDPEIYRQYIHHMFPAVPIQAYARKIATNSFEGGTGFTVSGGLKDGRHITSLSNYTDNGYQHDTVQRAITNLDAVSQQGHTGLDWSVLSTKEREKAGLPQWREGREPK